MENLPCPATIPHRSALLVALFFLAFGIGLSSIQPLWVDEILQLMETRQASATQMIVDLPRSPGAVPLGYIVQQAGLRLTGYSVVMARTTPALFASASVYVVVLLAAQLGSTRPWIAGAIFAAFPLTLRYATESRVYSQALFFSVAATLLQVRLTRRPEWKLAGGCCLALIAAAYTYPYAACVGLAHVLWSAFGRNQRSTRLSAIALIVAGLAFLPWFLWARGRWAAGIAQSALRFHFSAATPLIIFRESIGAGYWGAGCVVLLCGISALARWPPPRAASLLGLIVSTVVICVLAMDARFGYFVAARQFLWILPSVAILAATAIERTTRTTLALAILLGLFCVRQSTLFFLYPREDWQAASDYILHEAQRCGRLVVVPAQQRPLYAFFHPELCCGPQVSNRIVMAITPYTTGAERQQAIATTVSAGYDIERECDLGGSHVVSFRKH
jgi:hypothetical protein